MAMWWVDLVGSQTSATGGGRYIFYGLLRSRALRADLVRDSLFQDQYLLGPECPECRGAQRRDQCDDPGQHPHAKDRDKRRAEREPGNLPRA